MSNRNNMQQNNTLLYYTSVACEVNINIVVTSYFQNEYLNNHELTI